MVPPRLCAAVTAIALAAAPGSARAAPLSENFEAGAPGWASSGLWHVQPQPETVTVTAAIGGVLTSVAPGSALPAAWDGAAAAWFGDPATGTYCTGFDSVAQHPSDGCRSSGRVRGTLTSPPFAVTSAPATLEFRAWWEIAGADFETSDRMTVEYSTDDGATWTEAAKLNPSGPPFGSLHQSYTTGGLRQPGEWRAYSVDLTPALGSTNVRVRFNFDSIDSLGQGFRGLLIDGVNSEGTETPPVAAVPGAVPPPGQGSQPSGAPGGAVLGQSVVIEPVSGRVAYRTPDQRQETRLLSAIPVPIGTVVDATRGVVRITAADGAGGVSVGTFHDSPFQIRQGSDGVVELALRGGRFPHCDGGCTSAVRRKASVRRLWGSASGRFRTRAHYASCTVRGTNWLIEDQPGDTLVKVRTGSVLVRDFVLDRDVILNKGETYVARVVYVNRRRGNPRFGQTYTIRVRNGLIVHVYQGDERVVLTQAG
jgi:hypothetical protein